MRSFIETCLCKGCGPEGINKKHIHSRTELITRLLKNRRVVRFIVAPQGFGKTSLAYEYADLIFGFHQVFWINCLSPCFLRDLDAERIAQDIQTVSSSPGLVIFEDVPFLDDVREAQLAHLVNQLIDADIEVIVTCSPSAAICVEAHRDRVVVNARMLLLTDEEVAVTSINAANLSSSMPPVYRVPVYRWGVEPYKCLLSGLRREELPNDVRLTMFVMLVLGEGSLGDLANVVPGQRIGEIVQIIDDDYVIFGISRRHPHFNVGDVELSDVATYFCSRIDDLAISSVCASRDGLCSVIADSLASRGLHRKAGEFEARFAEDSAVVQWAIRWGWGFIESNEHLAFNDLIKGVVSTSSSLRDRICALSAWALYGLGEDAAAFHQAKRLIASPNISTETEVQAAVLLTCSPDEDAWMSGLDMLADVQATPDKRAAIERLGLTHGSPSWCLLADLALVRKRSLDATVAYWEHEHDALVQDEDLKANPKKRSLLLGASWIMDEIASQAPAHDGESKGKENDDNAPSLEHVKKPVNTRSLDAIIGFITSCAESQAHTGSVGWYTLRAMKSLERTCDVIPCSLQTTLHASVLAAVSYAENAVLEQRNVYDRRRAGSAAQVKLPPRNLRYAGSYAYQKQQGSSINEELLPEKIPTLYLRLFGSVEASIDGKLIGSKEFGRQKTRCLLVILALNRGHELERDRLAELLWPDSSIETARRNFYTVWSQLKRALRFDPYSRSCPYLNRSHYGCCLDSSLVETDLDDYKDLCRRLMFGPFDSSQWEVFYQRISTEFTEDLMSGEHDNVYIVTMRETLRSQMIDGLIDASVRLRHEGQLRGALWLAREALRRDECREDGYSALMQAQIEANQRSAAIGTYLTCRETLQDRLGIDPSDEIEALYRSIL